MNSQTSYVYNDALIVIKFMSGKVTLSQLLHKLYGCALITTCVAVIQIDYLLMKSKNLHQ